MAYKIDWPQRGHGYTEEEIAAVATVMRASVNSLTQGPNVQHFEQSFAEYLGAKQAFATMSCAHALDIAAMLSKISPGDEVIVPSHTYCASALAFARRGAILQWADIDPDSLTMSPDSMLQLVTSKTRAIVLVHLYGLLSPHVREIAEFARQHGILLIEDCAQSLGAQRDGAHGGTFGDIGCYSFHAQKNLTTLGEGGMLIVKSPDLAKKIPGLRLNGHAPYETKKDYWLPAMTNLDLDLEGVWPMKSTMNEAQAAVGALVLKRLDDLTCRRRERGIMFRRAMADFTELHFQAVDIAEAHSHHLLPARYDGNRHNRDDLIRLLSTKYGIKAIIQYHPLHRYDLFVKMGYGNAHVPQTDRFFDNMISFPFSLEISDSDFEYEIEAVRDSLSQLRG